MAHDNLAEQINTVVKVLLLVRKRIGVVVVAGVVGFSEFVYAVECVKDVESRKIAALFVIQRHRCDICLFEVFLFYAEVVVLTHPC